ncbi:MAG: hypothetical protein AAB767_00640 [Patescibacteria group bacterium]
MTTKKTLLALGALVVLAVAFSVWNKNEPSEVSVDDYTYYDEDALIPKPVSATPQIKVPASKTTSPTYVAPAVSTSPVRVLENGQYISIVNLMNKGFVPQAVSINRGESVRFVNKSGNAMRIMSATEYLGLDQQQSVGMNGTFELSFPRVGTWVFTNGRNQSVIGIVHVK